MDAGADRIVRRNFPLSKEGYDRAAVDAYLDAVGAAPRTEAGADARSPAGAGADREVLAAGRLLLEEISALRAELKRLSATLRDQSATIAEALEELLDVDEVPDVPADPPPAPVAVASAPAVPAEADPPPPVGPADPPRAAAAPADPLPDPFDPEAAVTLEDARLVALDLALGGSSREEIDRQLAARFELADRAALVDDVLAALG